MNRLKAVSVLVALGSIAIVTVLTSQATRAADSTRPLLRPVSIDSALSRAAIQPFTQTIICLVNITTTPSVTNISDYQSAAVVAPYSGLALIPQTNVPPTPTPHHHHCHHLDMEWSWLDRITLGRTGSASIIS